MQNPPPAQPAAPATGSGLDPKVAAALSYIWIVGLIFFFIEKENRFIRFHALQSIIFGVANSVILVVLMVVTVAGFLWVLDAGLSWLVQWLTGQEA